MTCFRMDNNQTLHRYCIEHGYNYGRIVNRIEEKGMTPEEAVRDYVPNKGRKDMNLKYFYQGIKLIKFCEEKNINYFTVMHKIHHGMGMDDAVVSTLNKRRKQ